MAKNVFSLNFFPFLKPELSFKGDTVKYSLQSRISMTKYKPNKTYHFILLNCMIYK